MPLNTAKLWSFNELLLYVTHFTGHRAASHANTSDTSDKRLRTEPVTLQLRNDSGLSFCFEDASFSSSVRPDTNPTADVRLRPTGRLLLGA